MLPKGDMKVSPDSAATIFSGSVDPAFLNAAAAALKKAGSTDPERIIAALAGLTFPSPFGSIMFRPIDHQSTMGAYVGRTAVKDGKGVMVDWRYADGKDYLPPDAVVRALRPQ